MDRFCPAAGTFTSFPKLDSHTINRFRRRHYLRFRMGFHLPLSRPPPHPSIESHGTPVARGERSRSCPCGNSTVFERRRHLAISLGNDLSQPGSRPKNHPSMKTYVPKRRVEPTDHGMTIHDRSTGADEG